MGVMFINYDFFEWLHSAEKSRRESIYTIVVNQLQDLRIGQSKAEIAHRQIARSKAVVVLKRLTSSFIEKKLRSNNEDKRNKHKNFKRKENESEKLNKSHNGFETAKRSHNESETSKTRQSEIHRNSKRRHNESDTCKVRLSENQRNLKRKENESEKQNKSYHELETAKRSHNESETSKIQQSENLRSTPAGLDCVSNEVDKSKKHKNLKRKENESEKQNKSYHELETAKRSHNESETSKIQQSENLRSTPAGLDCVSNEVDKSKKHKNLKRKENESEKQNKSYHELEMAKRSHNESETSKIQQSENLRSTPAGLEHVSNEVDKSKKHKSKPVGLDRVSNEVDKSKKHKNLKRKENELEKHNKTNHGLETAKRSHNESETSKLQQSEIFIRSKPVGLDRVCNEVDKSKKHKSRLVEKNHTFNKEDRSKKYKSNTKIIPDLVRKIKKEDEVSSPLIVAVESSPAKAFTMDLVRKVKTDESCNSGLSDESLKSTHNFSFSVKSEFSTNEIDSKQPLLKLVPNLGPQERKVDIPCEIKTEESGIIPELVCKIESFVSEKITQQQRNILLSEASNINDESRVLELVVKQELTVIEDNTQWPMTTVSSETPSKTLKRQKKRAPECKDDIPKPIKDNEKIAHFNRRNFTLNNKETNLESGYILSKDLKSRFEYIFNLVNCEQLARRSTQFNPPNLPRRYVAGMANCSRYSQFNETDDIASITTVMNHPHPSGQSVKRVAKRSHYSQPNETDDIASMTTVMNHLHPSGQSVERVAKRSHYSQFNETDDIASMNTVMNHPHPSGQSVERVAKRSHYSQFNETDDIASMTTVMNHPRPSGRSVERVANRSRYSWVKQRDGISSVSTEVNRSNYTRNPLGSQFCSGHRNIRPHQQPHTSSGRSNYRGSLRHEPPQNGRYRGWHPLRANLIYSPR